MRFRHAVLFCAGVSSLAFTQGVKGPATQNKTPAASHEVITAKVETVFRMADNNGFEFNAYQITFMGNHVIVEDPICSSNAKVGDEIRVIVVRSDLSKRYKNGKKLLGFIVTKFKA